MTKNEAQENYHLLIEKNKNDPPSNGENHHIIPKSCGGLNEKTNIVLLSFEDHYKAHYYLCFMYTDEMRDKMLHAWWWMSNRANVMEVDINKGSQEYKVLREAFVEKMIERNPMKGRPVSKKSREKMRQAKLGTPSVNIYEMKTPEEIKEIKAKISAAGLGRKHPKKTCPFCGFVGAGAGMVRFHFDNCRENTDRTGNPKIVCPHCDKKGYEPGMKRWHFDNCKEKND